MRYTYYITVKKPLRCDGQHLGTHLEEGSCHSVNEVHKFINASLGMELVTRDMVSNYFLRKHLSNKKLFGQTVLLTREIRHNPSCSKE